MASQQKRKHSYGLVTRLVVIATFIGLGSWAVFNSKFRKDQVAKESFAHDHEESDENESESTDGSPVKRAVATDENKSQNSTVGFLKQDNKSKTTESGKPTLPPSKSISPPPKKDSSSFGNSKSGKGGFSPPDPASFANLKSKSGLTTKQTDSKKSSSLPSSTFSLKNNSSTRPSEETSKSGFPKSIPGKSGSGFPASKKSNSGQFSFASNGGGNSKSAAKKSNEINKPSSTFNPSPLSGTPKEKSSALAEKKSGFNPTGSFNPTSNGTGSKVATPPKSVSQFGSGSGFPGTNSGVKANSDKRGVTGNEKNTPVKRSFSGDFSSSNQVSNNKEKPLRSNQNPSALNNQPNSKFSLGSGNFQSTPASEKPLRKSPNRTVDPDKFKTGSAFVDKGSKKLSTQDAASGTHSFNKTQEGNGRPGPSNSGFANLDQKKPGNGGSTSLDPSGVRPSKSFSSNSIHSSSKTEPQEKRNQFSGSNQKRSGLVNGGKPIGSNPTTGVDDNRPGPSTLEGIQAPAVTLQKVLPGEVQVGVETTFRLVLRNVGRSKANNVVVIDQIPQGTEFRSANPPATSRGTDGSLIWKFGSIAPSETKVINLTIIPKKQGEIGSVARMSFESAATAKTICTKPNLQLTHTGPAKVMQGQNAQFVVTIKNNGDGMASNVSIEEEVPEGFAFANKKGDKLAYEIGNLPPNQSRNVTLTLRAVTAGKFVSTVNARMGKTLTTKHQHHVEIIAPKLQMKFVGPNRRYIQREASYKVEIENVGTAAAKNVIMVAKLPRGLRFVRTNNQGQYNPREHAVYWQLVSLIPQNKGTVELKVMPTGTGQQEIVYEARSLLHRTELKKFPVLVDHLAELFFEVDDRDDPIEVDGETEYRIRVVNQGSKNATNVNVSVEMPNGIQAIDSNGPTKGIVAGRLVKFNSIAQLRPRGEAIFKIKAKGVSDGDHLVKVMLSSDERREVVAKQESTKVYSEFR